MPLYSEDEVEVVEEKKWPILNLLFIFSLNFASKECMACP
jgi:hypothetical protein